MGRRLVRCKARVAWGALVGAVCAVGIVAHAGGARTEASATKPLLDATHLPPLLRFPGEDVDLRYDITCATDADLAADAGCDLRGAVFHRPVGSASFARIELHTVSGPNGEGLAASVPDDALDGSGGLEYYAQIDSGSGESVTVPAGGAEAPHVSLRVDDAVDVDLGHHPFARATAVSERVVFVPWGSGRDEAGLEPGRSVSPVGASAFDVDAAGRIFLLDQVKRRVLRWGPGARRPARVPVSVNGTIADMAVSDDGSFFVLESTAEPGRNPLVRRFDDGGRELESVESAERTPSQIRIGPRGPDVLMRPSHQWDPVFAGGVPSTKREQMAMGVNGRPLRGGRHVVTLRAANELRVALVDGRAIRRAWRIRSDTNLAEVQLAEPLGGSGLVVVLRVYDDRQDEFAVLVLGRDGLVRRLTLESADWAEAAPLGRFRLVGRTLYRLGSTPAGVFVERTTLEVN